MAIGVSSLGALQAWLDDVVAGDLVAASVQLFQNDVTPTDLTTIADLGVATYTGFGAEAITWLAPSMGSDGVPEIIGIAGEFRPTGTTIGNQIYGAYLIGAGGALRAASRLPNAPAPMVNTGDAVIVTVRLRLGTPPLFEFIS